MIQRHIYRGNLKTINKTFLKALTRKIVKNPNQNATFFEKERSNDYEKHCGGSHSGGGAKPLRASNSNTKKGDRNLPTIN